MGIKKTHKQYVAEVAEKHGDSVVVLGHYRTSKIKIEHKCSAGHRWEARPNDVLRGSGCPECSGKMQKTHEEYLEDVKAVHGADVIVVGKYLTNKVSIGHRCRLGHMWEARPNDILNGSGCPECSGKMQKTHEGYVEEVKAIHGESVIVLGNYSTSKTPIKHQCPEGHVWEARPNDVLGGSGCPECSGKMQKTHEEYLEDVKAVHGADVIVVGKYLTNKTAIEHRCRHGHVWTARPNDILKGSGCPECSGKMQKTHEGYIAEVKAMHGDSVIVLESYLTSKTPIKHQCSEGHVWAARPNDVLGGSGCPECSGKMQKTHEEYLEEVKTVHGDDVIVVGKYLTNKTAIEHRCRQGHKWEARPNDILNGSGCPQCSASKGERRIARELNRLGISYRHDRALPWSKGKRYDFILQSRSLLLEYDGIQHFRPVDFSSNNKQRAEELFLATQQNDEFKARIAQENGYKLIRFKCDKGGGVPSDLEVQLRIALGL